jgi:eukaryotic-like serine/threonine-protein kinase
MGEVWAGDHLRLKLKVAMKILRKEAQSNHEIVTRFSREAFLLGQIQTDRVARVYDFFSRGRYAPVLVTEFIEGPSLAQLLSTRQLAVEDAIRLGLDLGKALRELHAAKIVHRDLKPANIMLRPWHEGEYRAVFVDLGVSRLLSDEAVDEDDQLTEITTADRCLGTIEYMAPEQILSSRSAAPAVDVYAVGAILFRAVAGRNVFGDLSGIELARKKLSEPPPPLSTGRTDLVAQGFEDLLARALSASPDERLESADELLTELSYLRDAGRAMAPRSATRSRPLSLAPPAPPAASEKTRMLRLPPPTMQLAMAAFIALGVGVALGAYQARLGAARFAPAVDTDRCRLVGHRVETPVGGGQDVIFSISCPASDAPKASVAATMP